MTKIDTLHALLIQQLDDDILTTTTHKFDIGNDLDALGEGSIAIS